MKEQKVISEHIYDAFREIVENRKLSRILLICGKHVAETPAGQCFVSDKHFAAVFQEFEPNPSYESVVRAVSCFKENHCDAVMAVGGGSAMDVGKCVKAFADMDPAVDLLKQTIVPNEIPYFAMPTTAGTGSEATSFAVIYYEGEKQSVGDPSCIPDVVFLDSSILATLPPDQKKATMLDAICHCVESFWAVNATEESREYAGEALRTILNHYQSYLAGDAKAAKQMLSASYCAGKAINISKTTAAHAMSYKLTKLYGIPHGQAAALNLAFVWEQTCRQAECEENEALLACLERLAGLWGCASEKEAVRSYRELLKELDLWIRVPATEEELKTLTESVNAERLKNHPVDLSQDTIREMYVMLSEGRMRDESQ
ncbi:MAG: phosphonoacetaldehyde reductase [Lachnospiraceae bacterium]|nr:phosphonoacetaldehyde reductase [Lachnospiraceae bacterium]MDE7239164.1 phosphonoacetaldehyde reductase [Lachnospiraceae bacterium]